MSDVSSMAFDSDFARSLQQGLAQELGGLMQGVDAVAARRQGRPFLGPWLGSQGVAPPFGVVLDPGEAPLGAAALGPIAVVPHCHGLLDKPVTSLFAAGEAPFTIGVATSEKHLFEALLAHAAAGFDAVCCPVGELDRPALQYLTEAGRELRLSPIWMVESERCLRLCLETDAPYFGFVAGDESPRFPFAATEWAALRAQLPGSARALCFYGAPAHDTHSFMVRIAQCQFDAYIDLSP